MNAVGAAERRLSAVGVALAVTIVYVIFAHWQWMQFTVKSWDLGIFTQLMQSYASFEFPIVNIKGDGYPLLGDHFHPLLVIFTPIYALFPNAFTLLVIQAACFGVAAGMLTGLAIRRLGSRIAGILLSLVFGLSWGLQNAAEAQFHEIALAVPLLTASLVAILDARWVAACVWAGLLVFVKEDLGLTVVVIGLVIAWLARRTLGVWLAIWGAVWFLIATLVVLPLLNPDGGWAYASRVSVWTMLTDPGLLFHSAKVHTVLLLLAITGGLLLRSPLALIVVPTLAWRFLSANQGYWEPTWHYSAVLMPVAFAALLDGIARSAASRWSWLRAYGRHGAAVAITAGIVLLPQLPLWNMVTSGAWEGSTRAEQARALLDAVPPGSTVESDIGLMSYLVDDFDVYWTGNDNPPQDCLVIDRRAGGTPNDWGGVISVAERLHPSISYELRYSGAGYELACRP